MKKRPWEIILISVIYMLAPIGNIFVSGIVSFFALLAENKIRNLTDWFNNYGLAAFIGDTSPIGIISKVVLLLYPVIGIMVLTVKKWGWYCFIAFSILLIIYNVFAIQWTNYPWALMIFFNVLIIGITALFFRKHVMAPYFNPRERWWEVSSRFKLNLTATLHSDHNIVESQVLDISKSGCFVQTETPLGIEDKIWLEIKFSDKEVDCFGKVVRTSGPKENKNGYGIMFLSIGKDSRNLLMSLIETLHKMGVSDRTFDEELNKNLAEIVK